jgi:hypothetical protein
MRSLITVTCLLAAATSLIAAENPVQRFVQDGIAIGFWVDPPADANMETHYRQIAEANFTVVLGGFGANRPDSVARQLRYCEKYGLKALVASRDVPADKLAHHPACWGYMVKDEPYVGEFPALSSRVAEIRRARPGKLAFINLFPSTADLHHLGVADYDTYVGRFVSEVDVDVLSMDYYPHMRPERDSRDTYCENLATMRRFSLERGIPFWNFFNTMPFGEHSDPTESQLRWQIYTSLAYGAKGVLYFCYWTPRGKEFPKGGAIITAGGRPTRHYEQARRINAAVKNLGPTLMKLTSTAVVRVAPKDDPAVLLKGAPIRSLTAGNYIVGVFHHADGRRAVMLNNYYHEFTAWPTVEFDVEAARVLEVSQKDGAIAPVLDDSPDMPGLQISLDSGEGRLFILPAKQASP